MKKQNGNLNDLIRAMKSNFALFLKGYYTYWHIENENVSEHQFCQKIQEITYTILNQITELYITKNRTMESQNDKKSLQQDNSANLEMQIQEILSFFKIGSINRTKKSSILIIQDFIQSIGNFMQLILPVSTPQKRNRSFIKKILQFNAELEAINKKIETNENLTFEILCTEFLYSIVQLLSEYRQKLKKEIRPFIGNLEKILERFDRIQKNQKKQIILYVFNIFSQYLPEPYTEEFFNDFNQLINLSISNDKANFVTLFLHFDEIYKELPSKTRYYKNSIFVQDLQVFLFQYETIEDNLHTKESIYNLGKISAKYYSKIKENQAFRDYSQDKPELQINEIHHDLEYIKILFEQMSFFYGFILGLLDLVNNEFDPSLSEYFTLNRYTLKNTYYSSRKIHKNNKWQDLNKQSVQKGLRNLKLFNLDRYFEEINHQSKKIRNYFGHKEGFLIQDKLKDRLYKIHTIQNGIEYLSFTDINEIKDKLVHFVPQFIGFIYSYILKNSLILDFLKIG
jgi:hypothetical protein